jgi:hypothetical protein
MARLTEFHRQHSWTMIWSKLKNMKLLLCVFEQLSGLKINLHKSEIFVMEKLNIMNKSTLVCLDAA